MEKYKDETLKDYSTDEEQSNISETEMLLEELNNPEKEELINKQATMWSKLNKEIKKGNCSESIKKEMKTIRDKIMVNVFSLYKKSYETNYETHKGFYTNDMITINKERKKISADKFYGVLVKSLSDSSSSGYDVDKNDNYMAYFRDKIGLRQRMNKKEIERMKEKNKILNPISIYAKNEEGEEYLITDTREISERYEQPLYEGYIKLLVPIMRLCETNLRNSSLTDNKKTKRWLFFRMFYTFDIVKGIENIKNSYIPPKKLIRTNENNHENITPDDLEAYCDSYEEFNIFKRKNHEIYRNMRLALVEILKEGSIEEFTDLLVIVRRCLKEGVNLEKRQGYVEEGIAKDSDYDNEKVNFKTVNRYAQLYKEEILKAIDSDELSY